MWHFENVRIIKGGWAYLYTAGMGALGKLSRVVVCKPKGEKGLETVSTTDFPSVGAAKAWREGITRVT